MSWFALSLGAALTQATQFAVVEPDVGRRLAGAILASAGAACLLLAR